MTRCPACDADANDRSVCPDCGAEIDDSGTHRTGRADSEQGPLGSRRQSDAGATPQAPESRQQPGTPGTVRQHQRMGRPPLPTGIKLVCALLVLSGLASLGVGMELRSIGSTAASYGVDRGGSFETLGLVVSGLGIGQVGAAVGLWTRESWGWTAAMGVASAGALTGLYMLTNAFTTSAGLLSLLVNGAIGWYVYSQRWRYQDTGQRQLRQPAGRQRQMTAETGRGQDNSPDGRGREGR